MRQRTRPPATCECVSCAFLRAHGREIEAGLELALASPDLEGEECDEAAETNAAFTNLLAKVYA